MMTPVNFPCWLYLWQSIFSLAEHAGLHGVSSYFRLGTVVRRDFFALTAETLIK
jgi:hypothetical protein